MDEVWLYRIWNGWPVVIVTACCTNNNYPTTKVKIVHMKATIFHRFWLAELSPWLLDVGSARVDRKRRSWDCVQSLHHAKAVCECSLGTKTGQEYPVQWVWGKNQAEQPVCRNAQKRQQWSWSHEISACCSSVDVLLRVCNNVICIRCFSESVADATVDVFKLFLFSTKLVSTVFFLLLGMLELVHDNSSLRELCGVLTIQ